MKNRSILTSTGLILFHYVGNRLFIVVFLAMVLAVAENIGILMLLPIIEILNNEVMRADSQNTFLRLMSEIGFNLTITNVLLVFILVFFLKGIITFVVLEYKSQLRASLVRCLKEKLLNLYAGMSYQKFLVM